MYLIASMLRLLMTRSNENVVVVLFDSLYVAVADDKQDLMKT